MKSTVERGDDTQEITYPRLMISEDDGRVVLFTSDVCGTIVKDRSGAYKLGYYAENWDIESFTPFNGSVTLENE